MPILKSGARSHYTRQASQRSRSGRHLSLARSLSGINRVVPLASRRVRFSLPTDLEEDHGLIRQLTHHFGPGSRVRGLWPQARLVLITYTVWNIPYRLALRERYDWVETTADAAFLAGLAAELLMALADDVGGAKASLLARGMHAEGKVRLTLRRSEATDKGSAGDGQAVRHLRPNEVPVHYAAALVGKLRSPGFWADVAASLCLAAAYALDVTVLSGPRWRAGHNKSRPWIYWVALVPKLVRWRQLLQFLGAMEMNLTVDMRGVAVFKCILFVYGSAHYVGCWFYFLSRVYDFSAVPTMETWVSLYGEANPWFYSYLTNDNAQAYLLCLYMGFSVITAQNYEVVVPQTHPELYCSIPLVFMQIILQSYIMGTINHHLIKKDERQEAFRLQMEALESYSSQRRLPEDLKQRLVQYFEFQAAKQHDDDDKVLSHLTAGLRVKVASFQYGAVMGRNMHLFAGCSSGFLANIMGSLRETFLMPGETVFQARVFSAGWVSPGWVWAARARAGGPDGPGVTPGRTRSDPRTDPE